MKKMMGYDLDDVLDLIGLERKNGAALGAILPAIGLLALGAAVGAGFGLAFAPSSGRRLRQDVGERLDQIRERIKTEQQKKVGAPSYNNATSQQS
ncbi:MAG: YtxH domain-containing protein [Polyangiaceae bacterium]|jgi:hypothetical protein